MSTHKICFCKDMKKIYTLKNKTKQKKFGLSSAMHKSRHFLNRSANGMQLMLRKLKFLLDIQQQTH